MFSTVMFSFNLYSVVCYVPFLFLVNEAIRIKLILSVKWYENIFYQTKLQNFFMNFYLSYNKTFDKLRQDPMNIISNIFILNFLLILSRLWKGKVSTWEKVLGKTKDDKVHIFYSLKPSL